MNDFKQQINSNSNRCNNVYGAAIITVNCRCESTPSSLGQSSTRERQAALDQANQSEPQICL